MTQTPHPLDVVAPSQIARLVEEVAIRKVRLNFLSTLTLGVLAGAFIALGAMFYTVTITGSELGFGPTRLLGGLAFSLGLVLVIIGGAELFTGNSLIVLGWANGRIRASEVLRNWGIVYLGNFLGAISMVLITHHAGILTMGDGAVGTTAVSLAAGKLALAPLELFLRGVLCNILVCLAVWMCFAAHSVSARVIVILLPVSAFVALGFEHSIANMYLIPIGMLHANQIDIGSLLTNMFIVSVGNVVGGAVLVALVFWLAYQRPNLPEPSRS